jgi:hypothetical protein
LFVDCGKKAMYQYGLGSNFACPSYLSPPSSKPTVSLYGALPAQVSPLPATVFSVLFEQKRTEWPPAAVVVSGYRPDLNNRARFLDEQALSLLGNATSATKFFH